MEFLIISLLFSNVAFSFIVGSILCVVLCNFIYYYYTIKNEFDFTEADTTNLHFAVRIIKNILLGLVIINIFFTICISLLTISNQFEELISEGSYPKLTASYGIISLEYFILGLIHFAQSLSRFSKDKAVGSIFHILMGIFAFYIQIRYKHTRLHHDFIGLLLMTLPFRSIQFVGLEYVIDSMCYEYTFHRDPYDFDSLVKNYRGVISSVIAFCCLIELFSRILIKNIENIDGYNIQLNTKSINNNEDIYAK
jgi:hypothetical protein